MRKLNAEYFSTSHDVPEYPVGHEHCSTR